MNKQVGILVSIIVILVAALAYLVGRNSAVVNTTVPTAAESSPVFSEIASSSPAAIPTVIADSVAPKASVSPEGSKAIWGSGERVSGVCNVSIQGRKVMTGSCSGASRPTDIVITADRNGCTIELNKSGAGASAKLYAYRNTCWLDEAAEMQVETDIPLGRASYQDGCWIGQEFRVCVK